MIARGDRGGLLDELVMPSVIDQGFDEVVLVGEHHSGKGYRHLPVPDITRTTVDALIKRDVGTAATESDLLVFLCDDHRLDARFCARLRAFPLGVKSIGVPTRFTVRDHKRIDLNMGQGYCGGHAGVFHRMACQLVPFTIAPHHPNWDVLHSHMLIQRGYELVDLTDCLIEDVEGKTPWL